MIYYLSRHPNTREMDIWTKKDLYYYREEVVHCIGKISVFCSPIHIGLLHRFIVAESEDITELEAMVVLDAL